MLLKQVELGAVAEEAGFVDGEILQQQGQLFFALRGTQMAIVAVEGFHLAFLQTPLQPVLEERGAALVEVHAALAVNECLQQLEFGVGKLCRCCSGCTHASTESSLSLLP